MKQTIIFCKSTPLILNVMCIFVYCKSTYSNLTVETTTVWLKLAIIGFTPARFIHLKTVVLLQEIQ